MEVHHILRRNYARKLRLMGDRDAIKLAVKLLAMADSLASKKERSFIASVNGLSSNAGSTALFLSERQRNWVNDIVDKHGAKAWCLMDEIDG